MMLASTGGCIRNEREPAKAAASRKTPQTLQQGAPAEKEKLSLPQKHAGGNETDERGWWGEELGGINDLFIQRGEYKRTGTLQDHLASRTLTQLFKTECRIGWFMTAGQKDSRETCSVCDARNAGSFQFYRALEQSSSPIFI